MPVIAVVIPLPQNMRRFVYTLDSATKFQIGGINGFAVTAESECKSGDVAILNVSGTHGAVKDLVSDRFYVVKEGNGKFKIDGEEYLVGLNDVVIVPPNTIFDFSGEMKLVMFCSPPFDPKNDVPV